MTDADRSDAPEAREFARLNPWGLVGATAMFALGLSPSLLPRDFFYQSIVSGLAAGLGYLAGLGFRHAWWRWLAPWLSAQEPLRRCTRKISPGMRRVLERALLGCAVLTLFLVAVVSLRWQRDIAALMSAPAPSLWAYLLVIPIGGIVFAGCLVGGCLLRALARLIARRLPGPNRGMGRRVVGWAAVLVGCVVAIDWAIPGTIVRAGEAIFAHSDQGPERGVSQPAESERSGSPASQVPFESLGRLGMRFVDGGLRVDQLAQETGRPAREPIRVYAGLKTAGEIAARAEAIIGELERTGARERQALLLILLTGTGWVNARAAQAFELLYGGDTAIVAAQYSYLPSAFHFLAGGGEVQEAGREIITPIVDWWNKLPDDARPRLFLYGESLGSSAVESAFSGMRDIANSVDGILLAGPPNFNPLWQTFVERRDPGTTEVAPEYSAGLVVRFAQDAQDIARVGGEGPAGWGPTRMLYIPHASDPVVWWSPNLIAREPDWLREPAGKDRLPGMVWLPGITFLQVSADLPVSQNVPQGHGHNYGDALVPGFAAIGGIADEARVAQVQEQVTRALELTGEVRFG
ncbi:alpha/beta hydrolase [Corynebacterium atypicum]|uniref:alpha/beta hydrolase n=1 Tax=Corynebacterium atypicum TaxID=191610 RepID=UPI00056EFD12|nr:alpha/beta hydrolase [Corynebacterium atypicum]